MRKFLTAICAILFTVAPSVASAAPRVVLNVGTQTYDTQFYIGTNINGGNLVAVIRCDSSNGSHQEVYESTHGLTIVPAMTVPPWPAPGELRGVETTDTGMLCVVALGVFKGNGFFQEKASDCFYVTVDGTVPDPERCFI